MIYVTTGFLLFFAVMAIVLSDTLLSVLSLASASIMLSVIFFQFGAPVAGVFELSVGAGLITILIILTISFLQVKTESLNKKNVAWIIASFILISVLAIFMQELSPTIFSTSLPETKWTQVGQILWELRAFDLLPLALVILSSAFGIIALLRSDKGEEK